MGAHILLVGEDNFEICKQRGVYGSVLPTTEWNKAEVIASIFAIQEGDLIFFYVKNKGVYGLWKVTTMPFYDEMKVWDNDQQSFPYRFCFEASEGFFPKPVSLSDILDLHRLDCRAPDRHGDVGPDHGQAHHDPGNTDRHYAHLLEQLASRHVTALNDVGDHRGEQHAQRGATRRQVERPQQRPEQLVVVEEQGIVFQGPRTELGRGIRLQADFDQHEGRQYHGQQRVE